MKKTALILLFAFFYSGISYAGGDDRDQVLELNFLNEEVDELQNLLQVDDLEEVESELNKAEEATQLPLIIQEEVGTNQAPVEIEKSNPNQSIISKYLKSDQGILIMLLLSVVGLILLFNFFFREKN